MHEDEKENLICDYALPKMFVEENGKRQIFIAFQARFCQKIKSIFFIFSARWTKTFKYE